MGTIDIIPDIHGQFAKLQAALDVIGWKRTAVGWIHPEPNRRIVFLGDFIDRGPENRAVIHTVRDLVDSGKARAIMGNHELNALHFHMTNPETGRPLRDHTDKNTLQHQAFLNEYPLKAAETREVLAWMRRLPLFLEEDNFRAVHACWIDASICALRQIAPDGVLTEDHLIRAANPKDILFTLVEQITKGPEHRLPDGFAFPDKDGTHRNHIRLQWWNTGAQTWRDIAISVPEPEMLPNTNLPESVRLQTYPIDHRPVFFGHYWLSGTPRLQGTNALCLDYSAGKDGPLVSYELRPDAGPLSLDRIRVHPLAA